MSEKDEKSKKDEKQMNCYICKATPREMNNLNRVYLKSYEDKANSRNHGNK